MIMALEITHLLVAAQSDDAGVRNGAEGSLIQFQEHYLPQFLLSLSSELANVDKPVDTRQLAGILLKNSLDNNQWIALDTVIKSQIKDLLLTTLASSAMEARHTAAQAIAKVASIEIPLNQWPQLVDSLLSNISQQASPAPSKQATLETIGYVCEEISHEDLVQGEASFLFPAVVYGTNPSKASADVHLAAIMALLTAFDSAHAKFQDDMEATFIIKFVCDSALSQEIKIRQTAFECLVSIASIYYEVLKPFIHRIFELTSVAIRGDEESVALQAIEFWSSICATEIELQEVVNPAYSRFIETTLSRLVPILLERLLKQQDDKVQGDDHVWNISRAGGTCLGLVARKLGIAIVPFVTSFVEAKISDSHWSREAATYAFGSILDVPTFVKLAVLEFLLDASMDGNKHVRDATACMSSRVFEFLHSPASGSPGNLPRFVLVLLKAINDDVPNVAEKICGVIYSIAQGHEDVGASSTLLTPYPREIIQHLLAAAEHTDEQVSKLRAGAAYDLLNVVVRCSSVAEASNIIAHLLCEIIQEIDQTMHIPILSKDGREKQAKLQASVRLLLQYLIHNHKFRSLV